MYDFELFDSEFNQIEPPFQTIQPTKMYRRVCLGGGFFSGGGGKRRGRQEDG